MHSKVVNWQSWSISSPVLIVKYTWITLNLVYLSFSQFSIVSLWNYYSNLSVSGIIAIWLRASVHFDRYRYWLLMKNFLLDLYILLNIPSKWCFIIQATFVTSEFLHYGFLRKFWVQIKLFKFDKLWEIFDKSSEHYEKMPYFSFKIFFQYLFQINEKNSTKWPL